MGKEILTFGNIEIEKKIKFYDHKSPIFLLDVNIEKVLVSNKMSFGEKNYDYFIGYLYNGNKVNPLGIILPKTSDNVLEKENTSLDKVSADIKNEFHSEPVYNKII